MPTDRLITCASLTLLLSACYGNPYDAFNPPAETYTEAHVTIEGIEGERVIAEVDSTFFEPNLPMLGRAFAREEYGSRSGVAILSHAFWVELGESPEIIGRELEVDGESRVIVGIMGPGVDVPEGVALWIPRD